MFNSLPSCRHLVQI